MVKSFLVLTLSLLLFAPLAAPQTKSPATNSAQVLKGAAQREAANNEAANELAMNPEERMQQELIARIFAERQSQLRRDTEKLVALTAELKQNVDKTNASILSMDVIKKAEEIQKLAKSVQDKMKNAY